MPDGQKCQLFGFFVFLGGGRGIKHHAGTCSVALSSKSIYISHKLKFIYQMRGFHGKIGPQFKDIMVIRLTENEKIVGPTNDIY